MKWVDDNVDELPLELNLDIVAHGSDWGSSLRQLGPLVGLWRGAP
jgi:hypothetical protein